MFAWVLLCLGFLAGPAHAADLGESVLAPSLPEGLLAQNPIEDAQKKKEEEDAAREERLKALREAQSKVAAKVVVLAWAGAPDVNYEHGALQANVKGRIARPDAKFYPEIDLYQSGRRHPDRTIPAAQQPGKVPVENIEAVNAAVEDIQSVPWNGMSESDWGITANNLRDMTELIWFVDREELRLPLFKLYVQIGRAAENMNNPVAPFYQEVGGQLVNYYWYQAGVLAYEDPAMLDELPEELQGSIGYYKTLLDNEEVSFMTVSFEQGGTWDPEQFATEYQVYINGLEVLISDPRSLHDVPPGRVDIFLKRTDDSFSISDRVDLSKLDDKIYFVRDVARKRMGIDFIDQLMEHPNECTPRVEGDILNSLAIYAQLHKDSEVFFAVPVAGDPGNVLVWRWNFEAKTLTKVLEEGASFPVRFAVLGGAGATFNGAGATVDPCAEQDPITGECIPGPPETSLSPSGVPFFGQLRGHWRRLMVVLGGEVAPSLGEDPWQDFYQMGDGHEAVDGSGEQALKEVPANRLLYTGVGVVFLKNAAAGIGPRGYLRAGWYNVPHTIDLTLHGGLTMEPPGMEQEGRVRLILDAEAFAGVMLPFGDTQFEDPLPSFGITVGAGTTF